VQNGLGLKENEEIVGFIYLGQPMRDRKAPQADCSQYVSEWTGE
jgi:hypothetical protein